MSPLIAINDPMAFVAHNPWGLQLAGIVNKGDYNIAGVKPGVVVQVDCP